MTVARLRFLYLHPVKFPGVEANLVQTAETCRALAERGHEVFLVTSGIRDGDARAALHQLDVPAHPELFLVEEPAIRLKNTSGIGSWWVRANLLWFLSALVKRRRTVLYFRTLKDGRLARFMILAARLLRVPVIYEAHKLYAEKRRDQGFHEGTLRRIQALEGLVLRRADGVVASHPLLAQEIRSGPRPRGTLATAPNGVRRAPAAGAEREFDAVYAGSLFPWKGVDVCLQAAARVEGLRLAIAGGNPPERLVQLREEAARLGIAARVTFLGQLPRADALGVVARSRAALVPLDPAFEEGERYTCPLKMLEAMVRGVPVVAADTPALREFVTGGATAFLFQQGDADSLAAALRLVREQPDVALRVGAAGRAAALQRSFDARARIIEQLATQVLRLDVGVGEPR